VADEPDMVVCIRRDEDPAVPSFEAWCVVCAEELWVSGTLAPLVAAGELRTVCMPCAQARGDTEDVEWRLHPSQSKELSEHGILDAAKNMVSGMNRAERRRRQR